jgi:hypothetical protein
MVPDLDAARRRVNETANNDLIDATASERLEQIIDPATMLPHYERLTWRSSFSSTTADGKLSEDASLIAVSEFLYNTWQEKTPKNHP